MSVGVSKIKIGDTVTGTFVVKDIAAIYKILWSVPVGGNHSILRFEHITAHEPAKVPVQVGDVFKISDKDAYNTVIFIGDNVVFYKTFIREIVFAGCSTLDKVQGWIRAYGNFKEESQ